MRCLPVGGSRPSGSTSGAGLRPRERPLVAEGLVLLDEAAHLVIELLAGGLAAKAIATRLGVAETTIRSHIHAILVELVTHSQLEAIAKARRLQLVN